MCWVQAETLDDNHTYTGDMILQKKKLVLMWKNTLSSIGGEI